MNYVLTPGVFISSDKKTNIASYIYTPNTTPCAIVQLIHGLGESVEDYERLADYLTSKGIVFCGNDHLGHGKSALADDLGHFGNSPDSASLLREDARSLYTLMRLKYRRIPYILLGCGFGSIILRSYMTKYAKAEDINGATLDGAILYGKAVNESCRAGKIVSSALSSLRGQRYRSKSLQKLAEKRYGLISSGNCFSSQEQARADATTFTVSSYHGIFTLINEVASKDWAAEVPKSLPVFITGGGSSLEKNRLQAIRDNLLDAEVNDVSIKIQEDSDNNPETVFSDLLNFVNSVCDGVVMVRGQKGSD